MPFITKCPHCQKFMLLEDTDLGTEVGCLLCKQRMRAAATASEQTPRSSATQVAPTRATGSLPDGPAIQTPIAPPSSQPKGAICQCPHCAKRLQIPPGTTRQIKCPGCGNLFPRPQ